MEWTKEVQSTVAIADGILDKRITTYFSDAAADPPHDMRIQIAGMRTDGTPFLFDCSISELSITSEQVAMLSGAGEAAVVQMLAKEGFSA